MESPALTGIPDYKPFPGWPLVALQVLLLALGVILSLLLRKEPATLPWMGGFIFIHWFVPGLLAVAGFAWALRRWRAPDRRRGAFWGLLILTVILAVSIGTWFTWHRNLRDFNSGIYSSRVEYATLADHPKDWLNPAHPQIYDLGAGLRLALSPVIWTDGLHRSLPRTTAPELEPYPESGDAKPLTELGTRNLTVLMKASALIRFFHPTDTAQFSDWGRLISQGVRRVEDAPSPEELAKRLQALLAPYAPQARFLLPGESVPVIPTPEGAVLLARWRHLGIGFECVRQGFTGPTKDRSARLAGVGMAWTTLQHFYPYWDVVPVDWEAVLPKSLQEAALAPTQGAYFEAIQHLFAQLKDGHAWPGDFSAPIMDRPDVSLEVLDGRVLVANRWGLDKGLPLGAEVLSIHGVPVEKLMAESRAKTPASTPQCHETWAANQLLLAPPRQSIRLEVEDLQGKRSAHDLIARRPQSPQDLPEAIREIKPGILLVDLERVGPETFKKALPQLVEAKGLILDHRGYPASEAFLQHFRTEPLEGPRLLLPVSLLPNGAGRTFQESRYKVRSEGPTYKGQVVVLAGGSHNISYAETCLEVVATNHLAPIVGRPTMGTNGDVRLFHIPGNIECVFTGLRVLKGDGSQHHGIGILPTHPVKRTREALAAGRDEDVERALALIETGS